MERSVTNLPHCGNTPDGVGSARLPTPVPDSAMAWIRTVPDEQWADALEKSYPKVTKKKAVEWWDGAPRDRDRYGAVLVHAWPGAEHREGGSRRVFGRRTLSAELAEGEPVHMLFGVLLLWIAWYAFNSGSYGQRNSYVWKRTPPVCRKGKSSSP